MAPAFQKFGDEQAPRPGSILRHRGERGSTVTGERHIVIADHRNVLWNSQAGPQERSDRAQCNQVAGSDDTVDILSSSEQGVDRGLGRFHGEMRRHYQRRILGQPRLVERFNISSQPLTDFVGVSVAEINDSAAPQPSQMKSSAASAEYVVRTDRAIILVGKLSAPHGETMVALRETVEGVVKRTLAEENDAVGPCRRHRGSKIIKMGRREVADQEIAAAVSRGVADPRYQFQKERIVQLAFAPVGSRNDERYRSCGPERPGRHVAPEWIIILPRELPDQLLRSIVDCRVVVQGARSG